MMNRFKLPVAQVDHASSGTDYETDAPCAARTVPSADKPHDPSGSIDHHKRKLTRTWTAKEIALLGTVSDAQVAERIGGISFSTVQKKRQELGIPSAMPAHFPWLPEHLALLGVLDDAELARLTGRSTRAVNQKRNKLGIPAARRPD
ncbi:hypothetical protein [Paraburkholderia sacchari]|uniref:Uncharacterized protein n=1 Tax=Paraburkholderia sacchari TaxID=159450 RepID=A0A8T6ZGC4_9BURK|nr:hypothetical protein [Paraburkholderia sacchari]NLP63310.1 hypothetical protein [Paraburkholderia sacchari]